jgi:hypothetical protein
MRALIKWPLVALSVGLRNEAGKPEVQIAFKRQTLDVLDWSKKFAKKCVFLFFAWCCARWDNFDFQKKKKFLNFFWNFNRFFRRSPWQLVIELIHTDSPATALSVQEVPKMVFPNSGRETVFQIPVETTFALNLKSSSWPTRTDWNPTEAIVTLPALVTPCVTPIWTRKKTRRTRTRTRRPSRRPRRALLKLILNRTFLFSERPNAEWPGAKPDNTWPTIYGVDDENSPNIGVTIKKDICGPVYHVKFTAGNWNYFILTFIKLENVYPSSRKTCS